MVWYLFGASLLSSQMYSLSSKTNCSYGAAFWNMHLKLFHAVGIHVTQSGNAKLMICIYFDNNLDN